jgi:thymidylate kinase
MAPQSHPGPIVAIEGVSGAGKSRLTEAIHRRTGWPVVEEAWARLGSRVDLAPRNPRALLRVERHLLAEEERRYREARQLAEGGSPVVCDTGFVGPLTYSIGLSLPDPPMRRAALDLVQEAREVWEHGDGGMADLTLYLDTPARVARTRAGRSPRDHPPRYRAQHAEVGEWERALWDSDLRSALGTRFIQVRGGRSAEVVERAARRAIRPMRRPIEPERSRAVLDALERAIEGATLSSASPRNRRSRP